MKPVPGELASLDNVKVGQSVFYLDSWYETNFQEAVIAKIGRKNLHIDVMSSQGVKRKVVRFGRDGNLLFDNAALAWREIDRRLKWRQECKRGCIRSDEQEINDLELRRDSIKGVIRDLDRQRDKDSNR